MSGKNVFWTTILFSLFVIAAYVSTNVLEQEYEYRGSLYDPFPEAYPFQLTNFDSTTFDTGDFRSKVILLFFGYTNCPDVCPTTLTEYKRIRTLLEDRADEVAFVFISVDPERDDLERIGAYVTAFDEHFYGLSGSDEELEEVFEGYFIYSENEQRVNENDLDYLVSHTSRIYVVDTNGNLHLTFNHEMTARDMYDDIIHLLDE